MALVEEEAAEGEEGEGADARRVCSASVSGEACSVWGAALADSQKAAGAGGRKLSPSRTT